MAPPLFILWVWEAMRWRREDNWKTLSTRLPSPVCAVIASANYYLNQFFTKIIENI